MSIRSLPYKTQWHPPVVYSRPARSTLLAAPEVTLYEDSKGFIWILRQLDMPRDNQQGRQRVCLAGAVLPALCKDGYSGAGGGSAASERFEVFGKFEGAHVFLRKEMFAVGEFHQFCFDAAQYGIKVGGRGGNIGDGRWRALRAVAV